MLCLVRLQRFRLDGRLVRHMLRCPYLTMRVRIAGAHHRAAVLEDLHIVEFRLAAELGVLLDPGIDDEADGGEFHARDGEAVVGMEAEDAAPASLLFRVEKRRGVGGRCGRVGQEGGVVVVENEYAFITRRKMSAGALVSWAEIAFRVVVDAGESRGWIDFSLPGALSAVG